MNNSQKGTLSMSVGTVNYLRKNAAILSIIPGFIALFTKFEVNVNGILVLRGQQEVNKSGIRDNKELLRADLAAKAFDIGRKTEAFASSVNNLILAKEVHYPGTSFTNASDSKLESRAQVIYEKANANIADLAPFDVSADDLIGLQMAIDLFHAAVPAIRTGTTEKKQITSQIAKLLKENDALLVKMDLLVEVVRLKQPDFYKGYKDNRMIIKIGSGTLALVASASDAATGEGLKGVKFTFVRQNENRATIGAEPLVKVTAKKGRLNVKNMNEGPYLVIIEKSGLKRLELQVNKVPGDLLRLNVKLEKLS